MNRGSRPWNRLRRSSPDCFNEAPIHESGKLQGPRLRTGPSIGFNEAPIHESGKFVSQAKRMRVPTPSFNEAAIHESGK